MSRADRLKWNEKHRAAAIGTPSARLIRWRDRLPENGRAIDLACGTGANALWLARDRVVDALDCSVVALSILGRRRDELGLSNLHRILADLDEPPFSERAGRYSLVCITSFLDRRARLWIDRLLAPGGLLFFETFHVGHLSRAPSFHRDWLLDRGELRSLFGHLEHLEFEEDDDRSALLARRPS